MPCINELPAETEWVKIGESVNNLALNALDIRRDAVERAKIELFVEIRNFGTEDVKTAMTVELDGEALDHRVVDVPAGRSVSRVLRANRSASS